MSDTAYRDPNAGLVETLRDEIDHLRRDNDALRADRTKARAAVARTAMGYAAALTCIAGCVVGVGAAARTCSYGADGRRIAEREAAEFYRRTHGAPPFAAMCARTRTHEGPYGYICSVYATAGVAVSGTFRCDGDPPKWNDGCAESGYFR
mgnify:FL=1